MVIPSIPAPGAVNSRSLNGPFPTTPSAILATWIPPTGGDSQRYMFTAEWHGQLTDNSYSKAILYTYYYDLDLFSDFTYFLDNPVLGDQFEQKDQRVVSGLIFSPRPLRTN